LPYVNPVHNLSIIGNFVKKRLLSFAVVLLYCAWAVSPAFAHAVFVRSNPAPNAVLAKSPPQVEIYFSEALQPGLSSISVYDSTGLVVDVGDVRVDSADPTRMTVSLHTLPDGVYTVSWKAISGIDGHFATGSFPFAVGNANTTALTAVQQTSSSTLPVSALVAKWLTLAALALLVGQTSFVFFVWEPALKAEQNGLPDDVRQPPIWRTIWQLGWISFLAAWALGLLSQAGQVNGNELAWPWATETSQVLITSRLGLIWWTRLGLALLGIWLALGKSAGWKRWAVFIITLSLLFTVSLSSHAATEAHPTLPVLADWLHLIGMSFWFGGLAFLFSGLRAFRVLGGKLRTRLISTCITRFSLMALVSVGVIGITGLYAFSLRVGTLNALETTLYGHSLLIKQVFVAGLLFLAAVNLLYISPRLKRDLQSDVSNLPLVMRFETMVKGEIILACLLLAVVSLLTYLPPAKITPPSTDLTASANADDLAMDISISPGHVGQNTFTLHLQSGGAPVKSVNTTLLRFTPSRNNIPPSEVQLIAQGNGDFVTQGSFLSLPGEWQVQAVVRRNNQFDAFANFNFSVKAPGADNQDAVTPRLAGGLALLNGLIFLLLMFFLTEKPVLRYAGGILPAAVLVSMGIFYLVRPIPVSNVQANPIVPDAKSIKAGQALFSADCVACHGPLGKGDGPLAMTLNPRPADLSYHAIPGVHTDAQLYEWITNGFPGSRMPAWKTVISDTDRWNLVNFIRTLAPKQP
jgi:copper transport protein